MTEPDETLARVGAAIGLGRQGDRAAARLLFTELWAGIGGDVGDPLHRCAIAHAMADVQDDVTDELRWDLQALVAADLLTDDRVALAGMDGTAAGFAPSLHLNIAECYRKLGDPDGALEHLRRGRAALPALGRSGYASMIEEGLDRLAARLRSD